MTAIHYKKPRTLRINTNPVSKRIFACYKLIPKEYKYDVEKVYMLQSLRNRWWPAPGWLGMAMDEKGASLVELCPQAMVQRRIERSVDVPWPAPKQPWQDPVACGRALSRGMAEAHIGHRRLALAMPSNAVVSDSLWVDADLTAQEIHDQVTWVASQALQLDWDAVAVDYRRDETPIGGSAGQVHWFWAACPQERVDAASQLSRAAGLRLAFLGPSLPDLTPEDGRPMRYHVACHMAWQAARA